MLIVRASVALVVLAVIAGITGVLLIATQPRVVALPTPAAATGTGMPPWAAPADPAPGIRAAGVASAPMTGGGAHFHSHIDIRVNGRSVPVAANIGIDPKTGAMSELHTHDTSGLVHVESGAKDDRYVLGQLFTEWGVRLDATHLGGLTAGGGRTLVAYVDGKRYRGDPARIELLGRRDIALLYGTAARQQNPPASYKFGPGE